MVVHRHNVHKRGLSVKAKERVYVKRKNDKMTWEEIAGQVRNLQGDRPYWKVVRAAFWELTNKNGRAKKDKYSNCGGKAKVTDDLAKWLVKKMKKLRVDTDCTSADLQRCLAKEKNVIVEESTVRRVLNNAGFYYLARETKPRYDLAQRQSRVTFSKIFWECDPETQAEEANICLDGVVFTKPPAGGVQRENYIHSDTPKVWRGKDEQQLPELAGYDRYQKQVPPARMIPIWGGVGPGGFATVLWHDERKTDNVEWSAAVRAGSLTQALRAVNPQKKTGPWKVLCDNESFLEHATSKAAYRRARVTLLHIPAGSPDLNPVEKFWGWTRKRLHKMDLADLRAGRPVPGKTAYKQRVRRLLSSAIAQQKAKNFYGNLRTVSARIVKAKGHAVKG